MVLVVEDALVGAVNGVSVVVVIVVVVVFVVVVVEERDVLVNRVTSSKIIFFIESNPR